MMNLPSDDPIRRSRRDFLTSTASGVGLVALASMLKSEGLLASEVDASGPISAKLPHFAAKAKACICIYLEGAPSQIDLFDPKPKLNELNGQALPESFTKNVRFAFIQKETAQDPRLESQVHEVRRVRAWSFRIISRIYPNASTTWRMIRSMHTEQFNHHPGQLMMNCGVPTFGRPSMGAWLNYGLGSESENLPGYVVLTAGRGHQRRGLELVERVPAHALSGRPVPQLRATRS